MTTRIVATFRVTGWEQVPYDEQAAGHDLSILRGAGQPGHIGVRFSVARPGGAG